MAEAEGTGKKENTEKERLVCKTVFKNCVRSEY